MKSNYNSLPNRIQKYLEKFYVDKWRLMYNSDKKFLGAVVVPVLAEYENLKILLDSIFRLDKKFANEFIFIFVVNRIIGSDEKIFLDNQKSLSLIKRIIEQDKEKIFSELKNFDEDFNFGLVDVNSNGLEMPAKEGGVGLARKIGLDLALQILYYDSGENSFLVCLDADCEIEKNYLSALRKKFIDEKISAASIFYKHRIIGDEEVTKAIVCYEIFLRYYVVALKYANSPYGFQTIGSSMAFNADSYVKSGGMNKRKAGEDFYFLEKLAKIVNVSEIFETAVLPSPRPSWRVPFGTGKRVARYLAKTHEEYLLYPFESFEILKSWLKIFNDEKNLDAKGLLAEAKKIHQSIYEFLSEQKFQIDWPKILKNFPSNNIAKQKSVWFDGFRTLKFIHYYKDNFSQMRPMFPELKKIFETYNFKTKGLELDNYNPPLENQIEILKALIELERLTSVRR